MKIEQIYTECHNHLREIDKNRNQIINFYLITIGAYLAIFYNQGSKNIDIPSFSIISLLLFLYGFVQIENLIEHRKWHTRYSYTARLLTKLTQKKYTKREYNKIKDSTKKDLLKDLGINEDTPVFSDFVKKYKTGTEFITYNSFLVLTFIPISSLMLVLFGESGLLRIFVIITAFLIYIFLLNDYAAQRLYKGYLDRFPWATWLIDGLEEK